MTLAGNALVLGLAVSGLSMTVVTAFAWRDRRRPGVDWFALHTGVVALWTFVSFATAFSTQPGVTRFTGLATTALTPLIAVTWFLFITAYLGYGHGLARRYKTAAVVLVTLGTVPAPFLLGSPLYLTGVSVTERVGLQLLSLELGPLAVAAFLGSYSLFFVGFGLIARETAAGDRLSRLQSAVLLTALALPVLVGFLPTLGVVPRGVPVVPLATGVSALLYTYALQRGTLLTLVPATERIGTRQALDDLDAGVVVTDGRRVVEANTAACRMLDRSPGSLVGVTPEAALSALDTSPAELPAVVEHDNRFYDVSTSPVTDDGGDRVGRTLLLTDVTDRRRRRQRLDVLNRVLRHNIRNKLTVVTGRTRDTAQRVGDETLAGWLADATAAAEDLLATSRKARAVEEAMRGATDPTTVSLAPAVAAAVDRLDVDPARVDVRVDPGVTVRTDAELLVLALAELVENAVEHGAPGADDPPATVTARETTTGVAVTVADDGPGIPASELAPLDAGGETQLEHASGLGLWLVDWATARLGGDVRFETDDGTRVVLSVPDAEAVSSPATTGPARVPEQGD